MTFQGWAQIALYVLVIVVITKPLGGYMTRVFNGERTLLSPVLQPVERLLYRVAASTRRASRAGSSTRSPCCSSASRALSRFICCSGCRLTCRSIRKARPT